MGLLLIFVLGLFLIPVGGVVVLLNRCSALPSGQLLGYLLWIEVYDDDVDIDALLNDRVQNNNHNNHNNHNNLRSHFGSSRGHSWPGLCQWLSSPHHRLRQRLLLVDGHPHRVGVGLPVPTEDDVAASLGTA